MAKLARWLEDKDEVVERPLAPVAMTLGRDAACSIQIDSLKASRRHRRIEPSADGGHLVVDLGSTNGTWVNGRRITGPTPLAPNDLLRVGGVELHLLHDAEDARAVLAARLAESQEPRPADDLVTHGIPVEVDPRTACRERLYQLGLASKDVVSDADLRGLLSSLVREAVGIVRGQWGAIYLHCDTPDEVQAAVAWSATDTAPAPADTIRGVIREALAARRPCRRSFRPEGAARAGSIVCVPLEAAPSRTESGESGALVIVSDDVAPLVEEDRRLLEAVGAQAAVVVQRAWLYRQATVDHLTQLTNRAWTSRVLLEELRRMRVRRGPLSVALLDLDHFKAVNDRLGHEVGDDVLREVAVRIRRALREDDLVGRWGGEEFLVVLAGVGSEGAEAVARKVAAAVKASPIAREAAASRSAHELTVTVSVGVATFPEQGQTPEELVRHADRALYAAKTGGRDRVVVYTPDLELVAQQPIDLTVHPAPSASQLLAEPALDEEGLWLCAPSLPPLRLPEQAVVEVGRAERCDLVIPDAEVAPLHVVITGTGLTRLVEDQGAGARLNGRPLVGPSPLQPGDLLAIGPHEFRVEARAPERDVGRRGRPGLLLVTGEDDLGRALEVALEDGFEVVWARTVEEALSTLGEAIDVVIAGDQLADGHGIDVLEAMLDRRPDSTRILLASPARSAVEEEAAQALTDGGRHVVLERPSSPADLVLAARLLRLTGQAAARARKPADAGPGRATAGEMARGRARRPVEQRRA